jgi:hypothetical protein
MIRSNNKTVGSKKSWIFSESRNFMNLNLFTRKMVKKLILMVILLCACGIINALAGDNLLKGGKWNCWINDSHRQAGSKGKINEDNINATVKAGDKKGAGNFQLNYIIKLEKDKKYKLSLDIKTDKAGLIFVSYMVNRSPWTSYAYGQIKVSPDKDKYECILITKAVKGKYEDDCSLRLFLGNIDDAELNISNIKLEEAN